MNDTLIIRDVDEDKIMVTLQKTGYIMIDNDEKYGYLLNMNIRSFTKQKLEDFKKNITKLETELKQIKKISEAQMWENDLQQFEKEYSSF